MKPESGLLITQYNAVAVLRTLDSKNPGAEKIRSLLLSRVNRFFESAAVEADFYFEEQAQLAMASKKSAAHMLRTLDIPFAFAKGALVIRSAGVANAEKIIEEAGFPDVTVTYFDLRALPGFKKLLAKAQSLEGSQLRVFLAGANFKADVADSAGAMAGDRPVSLAVSIDTRYPFDGYARYPRAKTGKAGKAAKSPTGRLK